MAGARDKLGLLPPGQKLNSTTSLFQRTQLQSRQGSDSKSHAEQEEVKTSTRTRICGLINLELAGISGDLNSNGEAW